MFSLESLDSLYRYIYTLYTDNINRYFFDTFRWTAVFLFFFYSKLTLRHHPSVFCSETIRNKLLLRLECTAYTSTRHNPQYDDHPFPYPLIRREASSARYDGHSGDTHVIPSTRFILFSNNNGINCY